MFRSTRFSSLVQALMAIILLVNVVGCATTPSGSGTAPVVAPVTTVQVGQPVVQPSPVPEPWEEDTNAFMNAFGNDVSLIQMAVILPYGGNSPDSTTCGEFWDHQLERHIMGDATSQHSAQQIMNFLGAVANGTAELVKVAVRSGGGIAALFRFQGGQWLFFIGDGLTPSAYKPLSQEAVKRAIQGVQIFKNPSNALKGALQTSARCFKETAPETVTVEVQVEVKVPVSEFSGQYDFSMAPTPVVGVTATPPTFVPVPVGSYGMPIPIQGTPPAFAKPGDYTYDSSHAVYYWTPDGGFGLTPAQMAEIVLLGGGTIVVVGIMAVTAEIWVPVVVIGAPSAAALVPAFAP